MSHPADRLERMRYGIPISGRPLRYVLTLALTSTEQPVHVDDLVHIVEDQGFSVAGRASKTISDALRWEVARDRVRRVGHGRYVGGRVPSSTLRWMRLEVARLTHDSSTHGEGAIAARNREFEQLLERNRAAAAGPQP
jgi:hypothetical protein